MLDIQHLLFNRFYKLYFLTNWNVTKIFYNSFFIIIVIQFIFVFWNNLSPRKINIKISKAILRFPSYLLCNNFPKRIRRLINSTYLDNYRTILTSILIILSAQSIPLSNTLILFTLISVLYVRYLLCSRNILLPSSSFPKVYK